MDRIPRAFEWLRTLAKADCSEHNPPRATRFEIHLPLLYRVCGEIAWREGRIVNISHTGVRFWTDQLLPLHTPIEMSLRLPPEIGGEAGAEIMCRGKIVRAALPAPAHAQPCLAASIQEYHFIRGRKGAAA